MVKPRFKPRAAWNRFLSIYICTYLKTPICMYNTEVRFYLNITAVNFIMHLVFNDHFLICIKFYDHIGNYVGTANWSYCSLLSPLVAFSWISSFEIHFVKVWWTYKKLLLFHVQNLLCLDISIRLWSHYHNLCHKYIYPIQKFLPFIIFPDFLEYNWQIKL